MSEFSSEEMRAAEWMRRAVERGQEVARLRAAIEAAPHAPGCLLAPVMLSAGQMVSVVVIGSTGSVPCTCWKAQALGRAVITALAPRPPSKLPHSFECVSRASVLRERFEVFGGTPGQLRDHCGADEGAQALAHVEYVSDGFEIDALEVDDHLVPAQDKLPVDPRIDLCHDGLQLRRTFTRSTELGTGGVGSSYGPVIAPAQIGRLAS